jgi:hypothetical protein
MNNERSPAEVRLTDGLGPLPEADVQWVDGKDQWGYDDYSHAYSAEAMTAYAAQQVTAERERINALVAEIRAHWIKANGEESMSVSALDVIAGVIADGSYVERA